MAEHPWLGTASHAVVGVPRADPVISQEGSWGLTPPVPDLSHCCAACVTRLVLMS